MVMWVCEAWQVNIWTVFAVRPNGPKNNKDNNFASSRSDHLGSDKNEENIVLSAWVSANLFSFVRKPNLFLFYTCGCVSVRPKLICFSFSIFS